MAPLVVLLTAAMALGTTPGTAWAEVPDTGPPSAAGQVVPGRFIVTFKAGVDARAVTEGYRRGGAAVDHVYTAATSGFAGRLSDAAASRARSDERVLRVEPDRVVVADEVTQTSVPWSLDRLDERPLALDRTYTYVTTASTVTAYVVDTGIRASHADFGGRVVGGYSTIGDGRGTSDCNGHGTHVAGTLGGATYGVAKAVRLVPVRVLDCLGSGLTSDIVAGLEWVTTNARKPAVANLSLGGPASLALDDAVRRTIASGVTVVAAAGNDDGLDACTKSPGRVTGVLTVAATDDTDTRAPYSNSGPCIDLFAPGSRIASAWYTSNSAAALSSGTSMAAPHVAGVAALHLAANPSAAPASVGDAVLANSSIGFVRSPGADTPNRLLHSRWPAAVATGTLTGTVWSSTGGAIAGATVSAGGANATTDHLGTYRLTLPGGSHDVTAAATGHAAGSATVHVPSGSTTVTAFTLTATTAAK